MLEKSVLGGYLNPEQDNRPPVGWVLALVGKNCLFQFQLGRVKWNWISPFSNTGLVLKNQAQNQVPSSIYVWNLNQNTWFFKKKHNWLARTMG